jgi:hypothetical protein
VETINYMTERKPFQFKKIKEKEYEPIHLPPAWCSAICRNAMSEACIEQCAIKRDCSGFDPKPNLKLADMPRFPTTEKMSREEKFTSVTIYLSKVVDHLQGVENEQDYGNNYIRNTRPYHDRTGSSPLSESVQIKDLLPHIAESITSLPAGEKREGQMVTASAMDDKPEHREKSGD